MQDTVQTTPATFTAQEPASVPRTISYPLKNGGSLTSTCPSWCTTDHTEDVVVGLVEPGELFHQGDAVRLEYTAQGVVEQGILEARIGQWPLSEDDAKPYVELVPESRTGVGLLLSSRIELDEEIRRVRAHLNALIELGDQLAEAQAVDHATRSQKSSVPWESLTRTDLLSLPIAYLLRAFGVTVVEMEDTGRKAVLALYGEPGAMEIRVYPDVPQQLREDETRRALLGWYDAKRGVGRV